MALKYEIINCLCFKGKYWGIVMFIEYLVRKYYCSNLLSYLNTFKRVEEKKSK